ncbi:hypothetical protein E2K93_15550 [Thalassotalea sp. HSM 43]|uniref:hypothetical protein n=1 Tax=Thalassotalea sp. HSM 43 TaxID=2552945 RepID=UPI00108105DB|nr:hypothetical protein [Thalassotalea sp. HSM 43]QBY05689.1 hypothetical protein E2K93_15550 [Thalassotalea sp. HSM 43]
MKSRWLFYLSAAVVLLYGALGVVIPQSQKMELLELYPYVDDISNDLIRKVCSMMMLSSIVLAAAFVMIARFLAEPTHYERLRKAAILLLVYPFTVIVAEVVGSGMVYAHLTDVSFELEISSAKFMNIMFAITLFAIARSQKKLRHNNQPDAV